MFIIYSISLSSHTKFLFYVYFMLTVAPGGNNLATICYNDFLGLATINMYYYYYYYYYYCNGCMTDDWFSFVRLCSLLRYHFRHLVFLYKLHELLHNRNSPQSPFRESQEARSRNPGNNNRVKKHYIGTKQWVTRVLLLEKPIIETLQHIHKIKIIKLKQKLLSK